MRISAVGFIVLISALAPSVATAQAEQRLTFADNATLKISVESGAKTATKSIVLVNSGPAIIELTFTAISEGADAPEIKVAAPSGSAVPAHGAARINLSFTSAESLAGFDGHLIAGTSGAAAERDLKFDAKNKLPFSVNLIIFGSFVLGAGLSAWRAWRLRPMLGYKLATPGWDFSKSWASTFTVIGALLGTILASTVLPDSPQRLSKETLAAMNLFFGIAILVAPFLFAVTESPVKVVTKDGVSQLEGQGTVAGYLGACAVTLTGVIGELVTVVVLMSELRGKGALPGAVLAFLCVLLAIAIWIVLIYAWRTMGWTALNATPPKEPEPKPGVSGREAIPVEPKPQMPAFSPSLL